MLTKKNRVFFLLLLFIFGYHKKKCKKWKKNFSIFSDAMFESWKQNSTEKKTTKGRKSK